jgi:outer membrane protein assembly factor BamA
MRTCCKRFVRGSAAMALAAFVVTGPAQAVESSYMISAGVGYTDNARLTRTDKDSETLGMVGLNLAIDEQTRRLSTEIDANLSYVEYLDNSYGSEVYGTATADLNLAILPERFDWYLRDTFGQASENRLRADTPDNRGYLNTFSTGPMLRLRLGSATRLDLTGEYSRIDYEEQDFDNKTLGGTVALVRLLSEASSAYVQVSHQQVEYLDQPRTSDYDRSEGVLGYRREGARMSLDVQGGRVELEREQGGKEKGTTLRLRLTRQLTPAQSIELAAGRELADATSIFAQDPTLVFDDGTIPIVPTTDPATIKYARLEWNLFVRRTGMSLGAGGYRDRYDRDRMQNRDRMEYSAALWRQLSTRTDLRLGLLHRDEEFVTLNDGFKEYAGSAGFNVRFSRRLSVGLEYQYLRRDADTAAVDEYRENRAWLRVFYGVSEDAAAQFAPAY